METSIEWSEQVEGKNRLQCNGVRCKELVRQSVGCVSLIKVGEGTKKEVKTPGTVGRTR